MHPNVQNNYAAMSQQCADVPSQNLEVRTSIAESYGVRLHARWARQEPCAIVDGGTRAWGLQAAATADARQNVEVLSGRFSNLFSQLAREEAALKAALSNNESLEQQLQDFRRQDPRGKLSKAGSYFDGEVAELRAEAQAAEHQAALQGGEDRRLAGALAAAQATYHRQCARLQERCQAEAAQERSAMETFRQSASELAHLKSDCSQLTAQLDTAEAQGSSAADLAQRQSLHRDLQLAKEGEKQMSEKTIELRQKLADGKALKKHAETLQNVLLNIFTVSSMAGFSFIAFQDDDGTARRCQH
ncbi:FTSH10 [Symbiodinium sp. CCMP2592]|nr:FTSH10 [Symbiodinium sp. CCMP2592]